MLRHKSREVGHFGRAVRNSLYCKIDVGLCLLFLFRHYCCIKEVKNIFFCVCKVYLFKALIDLFGHIFQTLTFIPCPISIPESKVN